MHGVLEVEVFGHGREIVSVVVHVVALAGLCGMAMAAPTVRDDPKAVLGEKQHLRIPIISREWPSLTEDDRLSAAPVLEEMSIFPQCPSPTATYGIWLLD